MSDRIQFHGDSISGNCYKLQMACAELGLDYVWHEMDILAGDTKTPEFLVLNPNGKVPVMVLTDGRVLPEWIRAGGNRSLCESQCSAVALLRTIQP